LAREFRPYRDEMIISTKAGWRMWPGPYGDWGSRKYLIASLDQSLKRMGIDYVDIFYHHRPDPDTPLDESMGALDQIVRSGKALYVGISQYSPDDTRRAAKLLHELGTPFVIHQPRYNMFDRWIEDGLLDALDDTGIGCIVFSPLAQGLLTDRYLAGIASDSRAGKPYTVFNADRVTDDKMNRVRQLTVIAQARGQSLAQMAIAWVLRHPQVTSAVIGTSRVSQIDEAVSALAKPEVGDDELRSIDAILTA
jgi:L-glyceraldehyde 3-phosphate reductase